MKNNQGFISTTLVVSTIIISLLLILIIMNRSERISVFATNVTAQNRERLVDFKTPNCFWGNPPLMRIQPGQGIATSTIILQCTHVDGIQTLLNTPHSTIISWVNRRNANNRYVNIALNDPQFQIEVVRIIAIPNGYRIVFRLQSNNPGSYFLIFTQNRIRTNDGFGNHPLWSHQADNNQIAANYIVVSN